MMSKYTRTLVAATVMSVSVFADAGAIRTDGFLSNSTLSANDDGSTGLVGLGFTADFYGTDYSSAYVNNNGNITFDSTLSTYTPFDLTSTGQEVIAPFFADIDTRGPGSETTYGSGSIGGQAAFGVNWIDVGHYNQQSPLNSFQLLLIDRSDISAGDFDIEFNYDSILWESGTASQGSSAGLGGFSARAGYSNGTGDPGSFFELDGSAVNGAFLDSNLTDGLIYNSLNSDVDGRYVFNVRNGSVVTNPTSVPEPASLALLGLGLAGIGAMRRKKKA